MDLAQDALHNCIGPQLCRILEDLAEEETTSVVAEVKAADGDSADRRARSFASDDDGDVVYAQTVRLTHSAQS